MANYLMRVLDPFGQELHAARIELEDVDGIDQLTGLMTKPDTTPLTTGRFPIKGGFDRRAEYYVEFTKE